MKRMSLLVLVAVLAITVTGCGTVRIPNNSDRGYVEVSGDLPKVGELVRVRKIIGHETIGAYQYDIIWSYYNEEVGDHACFAQGGTFPGLEKEGTYAVVRGTGGGIYFAEVT